MKTPEFDLLETLIAVAESKNFAEAGNRLGVSQPAVTQKLQRLGVVVPFPLFQMEGKRKVLTLFAQELYQLAKSQQKSLHSNYEELDRRFANAEQLTLRVGGRRAFVDSIVDRFLFEGRTEFKTLNSEQALAALLNGGIDIAVANRVPDSLHLFSKKIASSGCRIAVHRQLLKKKEVNLGRLASNVEFLKTTPCVSYQSDGHLLTDLLKHNGISFNLAKVRAVSEDWESLMYLIEKGHGYGVLPDYISSKSKEVVTVDISEIILPRVQFYAVFKKDLKKMKGFNSVAILR